MNEQSILCQICFWFYDIPSPNKYIITLMTNMAEENQVWTLDWEKWMQQEIISLKK